MCLESEPISNKLSYISSKHEQSAKLRRSPAYAIGKSERSQTDQTLAPGPGSYNLNQTVFVTLYSLRDQKTEVLISSVKRKIVLKAKVLVQEGIHHLNLAIQFLLLRVPKNILLVLKTK